MLRRPSPSSQRMRPWGVPEGTALRRERALHPRSSRRSSRGFPLCAPACMPRARGAIVPATALTVLVRQSDGLTGFAGTGRRSSPLRRRADAAPTIMRVIARRDGSRIPTTPRKARAPVSRQPHPRAQWKRAPPKPERHRRLVPTPRRAPRQGAEMTHRRPQSRPAPTPRVEPTPENRSTSPSGAKR